MSLKKKWLEALRGGQFKQGNGRLRSGDKYCCLGVLCEISKTGGWEEEHWVDGNSASKTMPPGYIIEQVGIEHEQALFLAGMNDSGNSFRTIADRIEEMFENNAPDWRNE